MTIYHPIYTRNVPNCNNNSDAIPIFDKLYITKKTNIKLVSTTWRMPFEIRNKTIIVNIRDVIDNLNSIKSGLTYCDLGSKSSFLYGVLVLL